MNKIKVRVGALLLALCSALGLGLAGAGPATADVPGYPTIAQYHGLVHVVGWNLTGAWSSTIKGEMDEWTRESSTLALPYWANDSGCNSSNPCATVYLVHKGLNGVRVSAVWTDANHDGFEEGVGIYINIDYGYSATEQRVSACKVVGMVYLKYQRPSGQESCVSRDPIRSTTSSHGIQLDRDYWNIGYNASFAA